LIDCPYLPPRSFTATDAIDRLAEVRARRVHAIARAATIEPSLASRWRCIDWSPGRRYLPGAPTTTQTAMVTSPLHRQPPLLLVEQLQPAKLLVLSAAAPSLGSALTASFCRFKMRFMGLSSLRSSIEGRSDCVPA